MLQLHQWALTRAALLAIGADDAASRARQAHRHRDALERMLGRRVDLARLSRTELEQRALEVGIGEEYFDLDVLRTFVARVEVERELRVLDTLVRTVTCARDWPALEEALRRGWAPVLRYLGHPEYDAAVSTVRRRIVDGGYRVLPADPTARFEEAPC